MTHPSQTKSYQSLLADDTAWKRQSWGEHGNSAIAFVPHRDNPDPQGSLTKIETLFANFGMPERDQWGGLWEPNMRRAFDISYLNVSDERLLATLTQYFLANLPRELGSIKRTNEGDEDGGDIDYVYDEVAVTKLADQCARHFIEHAIDTSCFMPDPANTTPSPYGWTAEKGESREEIETWGASHALVSRLG